MLPASIDLPVAIAILAQAPQGRLIELAIETARAACIGPVTLWATPGQDHSAFETLAALFGVALARQPDGDVGARMLGAIVAAGGPALVIGTDCPALQPEHLRAAADALNAGIDVVTIAVEDSGYALIGMRAPQPGLLADMPWNSARVTAEMRRRLARLALTWREPARLRDVERLRGEGLAILTG